MYKRKYAKKKKYVRRRRPAYKGVRRMVSKALARTGDSRRAWEYTSSPFENISTISVTDLTDAIPQGDGASSRTGDIVKLNGWRGYLRLERKTSATANSNEGYRIFIFQWLIDDTTDPPATAGELFYDPVGGYDRFIMGPPITLTTFNKYRIRILADYKGFLGTGTRGHKMIRVNIPARRLRRIVFSPGATTGFNKLYIVAYGESATGVETSMVSYYFSANFTCQTR